MEKWRSYHDIARNHSDHAKKHIHHDIVMEWSWHSVEAIDIPFLSWTCLIDF